MLTSRKTLLAAGLALASAALTAGSADAFTLSIDPSAGSTENTGATTEVEFNFFDVGNQVRLDLNFANTTDGSAGLGATQATLVGFAFDLLAGVSTSESDYSSGTFTKYYSNVSVGGISNGAYNVGAFDVGIRSAGPGNFTGGNPQGGVTAGASAAASFLLTDAQGRSASELEGLFYDGYDSGALNAMGRFQQVNAGGGSDKVLAQTPEPITLIGWGLGAAGVAAARKRKRQTA